MDGEQNGTQEQQSAQQKQGQQGAAQQTQQETQQGADGAATASGGSGIDQAAFEAQLAERDSRIAELEGQIAEAAKSAEPAEGLREEIAALKQQASDERVEFSLKLAGAHSVKAAKAVLEDYDGDIEKMREAEPWMFGKHAAKDPAGMTGLPNAGAASDAGKLEKHWREIAGIEDESNE